MTPFSLGTAHADPLSPCRWHWVDIHLRARSILVAWEGFPRVSKLGVSRCEEPWPKLHSCTAPAGPTVICVRGSFRRPNLAVQIKIPFSRRGNHSLVVQTIWNCVNSIPGGTPLTHCNRYFSSPLAVSQVKQLNILF